MRRFAVTWDYRCPYARIVHDHVLAGLRAGAAWEVSFVPFSLGQVHVEPGQSDIWTRPDDDSGLLALQVGVAVRDLWPDRFVEVHQALFDHRHVRAGDLRDRAALSALLGDADIAADEVWKVVDDGGPLVTVRDEHTAAVASPPVWGVPTFLVGDAAVFVRLLAPADGDGALAIATVERVLDQIDWPILNEFKHTSIPR